MSLATGLRLDPMGKLTEGASTSIEDYAQNFFFRGILKTLGEQYLSDDTIIFDSVQGVFF